MQLALPGGIGLFANSSWRKLLKMRYLVGDRRELVLAQIQQLQSGRFQSFSGSDTSWLRKTCNSFKRLETSDLFGQGPQAIARKLQHFELAHFTNLGGSDAMALLPRFSVSRLASSRTPLGKRSNPALVRLKNRTLCGASSASVRFV